MGGARYRPRRKGVPLCLRGGELNLMVRRPRRVLFDDSVWNQDEYLSVYRYAYRPKVQVNGNKMLLDGRSRSFRGRRLL